MGLFNSSKGSLGDLNYGLWYQLLPEELKPGYEELGQGLLTMQKTARVPSAKDKKDLEQILDAVMFDNPLLCYFDASVFEITSKGGFCTVSFSYIYDRKQAVQIMNEINSKADFIISQFITEDMDDYEKCLAIHDYMTENIQYNFAAMSLDYVYDAFTAEGALLKHRAVCVGIAKAVVFLLGKLGIPAMVVRGQSSLGGEDIEHGWNIVEINKKYYHIDVTWDLQEVNHFSSRSHMYMNMDDESMLSNHTWDIEMYPSCDSLEENYYVKTKRYFKTIRSFELYCQHFLKARFKYMDVRFSDTLDIPNDRGYMLTEIISKQSRLLGIPYRSAYLFNASSFVFQAEIQY